MTKAVKQSTSSKSKKKQVTPPVATEALTPDNLIKIWFKGWQNSFNLHGRSSRFELWVFMVVNIVLSMIVQLNCSYVLSPNFLRSATTKGYTLEQIDTYITAASIGFWLVILLPFIPFGALIIRRMHDLGRLAWRGYFEPIFMGCVVLVMINLAVETITDSHLAYVIVFLETCFVTILYSIGFYSLKILSLTFFYKGDCEENAFGQPAYKEEIYEDAALNLSCLYFLILLTIGTLYTIVALL